MEMLKSDIESELEVHKPSQQTDDSEEKTIKNVHILDIGVDNDISDATESEVEPTMPSIR